MYRAKEVEDALLHVVGWEQDVNPDLQIAGGLTQSESGLTFQSAHPMCTLAMVNALVPPEWDRSIKAWNGREKGILRKAFENDLPEVITWRKKSPYPKTFNPVYLAEVCKMVDYVLSDKSCPLYEMLNVSAVRELMQHPDSLSEPWYGQLMRAPQVLAYILQIYVWIRKYHVEFEL